MRIHQLLNSVSVIVSNEEHRFIKSHPEVIRISSLNEHEHWIAQNLVRKNVYSISEDSDNIILNKNHAVNRSVI